MEKQNDHKKFSKKIWVLSAGIIVILAIVLFAGIKNGFFLRKGDKILYAAYHTIKDQPETADVSKDEDYTVSMDGQWKEQKIQAEYASVSDQKQLKGTIDLDKLPDLEFVMTLDEKELKTQLPSLKYLHTIIRMVEKVDILRKRSVRKSWNVSIPFWKNYMVEMSRKRSEQIY